MTTPNEPSTTKSGKRNTQPTSTTQRLPGLGLAIGVFVGTLLFTSFLRGDITEGLISGAAAGFLVVLIYLVIPGLKS